MSSEQIWIAVGFLGQAFFSARFLIQWIVSEAKRKSVIPLAFWFFSLGRGRDVALLRDLARRPGVHRRPGRRAGGLFAQPLSDLQGKGARRLPGGGELADRRATNRQGGAMAEHDPSDFNRRIGADNLAPLWERSAPNEPDSPAVAAHWRYDDIRPHLIESGELISKEEAHRRVLVLENPGLRGEYRITRSLYAGLQLIHPGEIAPKPSPHAVRASVRHRGQRGLHRRGRRKDPHEPGRLRRHPVLGLARHGHEGNGPMVWLDVLDSPLVAFLDAEFREHAGARRQDIARPPGTSSAKFGQTMRPMSATPPETTSPVWSYPYTRARAALETLRAADDGGPVPRHQDGIHQPGDRAVRHAHDRDVFSSSSAARSRPRRTGRRIRPSTAWPMAVGERMSVTRPSTGARTDIFVVPSWRWHRHAPA